MRKLDLLVVSDEIASGIYEIKSLLNHIETLMPGFTYDVVIDRKITKKLLNCTKNVLFFRSRSVLDFQLAKLAKKASKTVYLFLDDDFLGLKDDYGINAAGIWSGRKEALRKMLPIVDAIISPNDLLCEKYASLGGISRKVRIDTPVDATALVRNKDKDTSRVVLYINDGSMDMFDKYLRPALKRLGELKPDFFTVDLLSLHPDCTDLCGISINYVPHMTYPEFREYMNSSPFYIGLAPLDNNGFNQFKYYNKYIEYTRAGILGIYSDCQLYRQVITNNVNGILVHNSANEWAESILYCVENANKYENMLNNAQAMISDQFNIDRICERLVNALPELFEDIDIISVSGYEIIRIKCIHYLSRLQERLYLLSRYFKLGGVNGVIRALKYRLERNKELKK